MSNWRGGLAKAAQGHEKMRETIMRCKVLTDGKCVEQSRKVLEKGIVSMDMERGSTSQFSMSSPGLLALCARRSRYRVGWT